MTDKLDAQIDRFFVDKVLPLAAKAKAAGSELLQTKLDPAAPTYYVTRTRKSMSKADFETGGCASPDSVEADFRVLWQNDAGMGLRTLAPGLAALAKELRAVGEEARDVSNFIYVMY